jgi:hypothetical protein
VSDHLGKGAGDYMRDYASLMFASNDAPDAAANLVKLLERCDKVEAVTGTIGAPPRDLLAVMRKMMDQLNKHTSPVLPMDKVVMGREAIEELARLTQTKGYHTPGPHATDPMGVITGIQIVESDVLDPDQWVAYDRAGKIVAMGWVNNVRFLTPERTYITTDPVAEPPSPSP